MSKEYNVELQKKLEDYLEAEGLSQAKAAPILGISAAVLSQYRRSVYDKGDIGEVEKKLEEFFRIKEEQGRNNRKAEPFRASLQGYIPTSISEAAYKLIRYCQLEKGIVVIDGDAGIGKTKAAAKFLQDNPSTTVYLKAAPSTGTLRSLLKMIGRALKLPENQRTEDLSLAIQDKLKETDKIIIIDERVSGIIEEDHAVFHFIESVFIDHPLCISDSRNMNASKMPSTNKKMVEAEDILQIIDDLCRIGQAVGSLDRQIRIIADDIHTQFFRRIGNQHADCAQADDTQGFAFNLRTSELPFALFDSFTHAFRTGQSLCPCQSVGDVSCGQDHSCQNQFLYCVGVGSRCVEDNDAFLCTAVQRNIVDAGSRTGDGQQAVSEFHIVHGLASDQNAVCFICIVNYRIIIGKAGKSYR